MDYPVECRPRTTDTQWRHKSKISEKLVRCGRQNMLRPYLNIWEWEWIFGRAVKAISSLGICSPCWNALTLGVSFSKWGRLAFFFCFPGLHSKSKLLQIATSYGYFCHIYWPAVRKVVIWGHGLSAAIKLGSLEKTVIACLFHSGSPFLSKKPHYKTFCLHRWQSGFLHEKD